MNPTMTSALWITLIGMGLVFIAILALWGMMALLVRLTPEREAAEESEEIAGEAAPEGESPVSEPAARTRKSRAAAAAVAVALASQTAAAPVHPTTPAGSLSAWQAVQRASQISQRVNSIGKKVTR